MPQMPHDPSFDSTLAFHADPYGFISTRCRELGTDVFEARILLHRTLCMTGAPAAELFCDPERFERSGAPPDRIQKSLFGEGGVQGLDGEDHRRRKQMFLTVLSPERLDALASIAERRWTEYAARWASRDEVVLYDELHELLTVTACSWAGVPLDDTGKRAHELTALFDEAGAVGPRHWHARLARHRADGWAADVIADVRAGRFVPPEGSACSVVAWHRDKEGGSLLHPDIAAVELLNVLRPMVAVSVFLTFVALALHEHRAAREHLEDGPGGLERFVQEVRRFYPFFPAIVARVRDAFEWNGYEFPAGCRALLDLYGTNHDPRIWTAPGEFRPERFEQWDGNPYKLIPQGPGLAAIHHRCPGEAATVCLMKTALSFLTERLRYEVPAQELEVDVQRLPALPRSGFVIHGVRLDP